MTEQGDWAAQTADTIEHVVGAVRSRTADPLIGVTRWVVYGLLAAIVGGMAVPLAIIAAIRALDAYLPSGVWLPDVVVGGIFALAGGFLWSKRGARRAEG